MSYLLSSPHLGGFISDVLDWWGLILDQLCHNKKISKLETNHHALLLCLLLQMFGGLLTYGEFVRWLVGGDGERLVKGERGVLRLLGYLHQTLYVSRLEGLKVVLPRGKREEGKKKKKRKRRGEEEGEEGGGEEGEEEWCLIYPPGLQEVTQLLATRMLVILCETEEPYFLDLVNNPPFYVVVESILWLCCCSSLEIISSSSLNRPALLEYLRFVELCCDDDHFKPVVLRYVTPMLLHAMYRSQDDLPNLVSFYLFIYYYNSHCSSF